MRRDELGHGCDAASASASTANTAEPRKTRIGLKEVAPGATFNNQGRETSSTESTRTVRFEPGRKLKEEHVMKSMYVQCGGVSLSGANM